MAITSAPTKATDLLNDVKAARRLPAPDVAADLRRRCGATQRQVAEALDVDRVTVARWEAGERSPRGDTRLRYIDILERFAQLLRDEEKAAARGRA